jgi:hypothetical protein
LTADRFSGLRLVPDLSGTESWLTWPAPATPERSIRVTEFGGQMRPLYCDWVLTHTIGGLQQAYLTLINKSEAGPGITSVKECSEEVLCC